MDRLSLKLENHVELLTKKIRRGTGILSRLRHFVNQSVLLMLYALIYPFLIYGITVWGSTYESTLKPVLILQKKAMPIIYFLKFIAVLALCLNHSR